MKRLFWSILTVFAVLIAVAVGAGMYMLRYSLSPEEEREDTARYFRQLTEQHPEVVPWLDSLRACEGLRDTHLAAMPPAQRVEFWRGVVVAPGRKVPLADALHPRRQRPLRALVDGAPTLRGQAGPEVPLDSARHPTCDGLRRLHRGIHPASTRIHATGNMQTIT